MKKVDLKEAVELTTILKQNLWVLVKFSATWCEPCQLLEPVFEQLSRQRAKLKTVCVNVDLHTELTKNYAVFSVPSLLLFKQGAIASQLSGLHNENRLNDWLNQHITHDYK